MSPEPNPTGLVAAGVAAPNSPPRRAARSPGWRTFIAANATWFWGAGFTLAAVAVVFAWAAAAPVGNQFDEDFHLVSIWCPTLDGTTCPVRARESPVSGPGAQSRRFEVEVPPGVVSYFDCFFFESEASAACRTAPAEPQWTSRVNDGGHGGFYYRVLHRFVGASPFRSVVAMRTFNGLLALALLGSIAALSVPSGRRLLALALLPIAVPFLLPLVMSTNPSGWAITGVAAAGLGTLGALRAQRLWPRLGLAFSALLGAGLAVAARSDATAFVLVAALAAAVLEARGRFIKPKVVAGAVGVAATGGLLLVVTGLLGRLLGGWGNVPALDVSSSLPTGVVRFVENVYRTPSSLFDFTRLLAMETFAPPIVSYLVLFACAGVLFAGLHELSLRKLVALSGTLAAIGGLTLYWTQVSWGFQGRYVLPLYSVAMAAAAWSSRHDGAIRLSRGQAGTLFALVGLAHAISLQTLIRRYATGMGVLELDLNQNVQWWHDGPSPMATWLIGCLGFTMLASSLFVCHRRSGYAGLEPLLEPLGISEPATPENSELDRAAWGPDAAGSVVGSEATPEASELTESAPASRSSPAPC